MLTRELHCSGFPYMLAPSIRCTVMNTPTTPDWVLYELGIGLDNQTPQHADNSAATPIPTVQRAFPYPDAWLEELRQRYRDDDDERS